MLQAFDRAVELADLVGAHSFAIHLRSLFACFFRHVGTDWASDTPVDMRRQRVLLEAYSARSAFGLPQELENVCCLIDDRTRLFTLAKLRAGQLVEPDFQALEKALRTANGRIGINERSERSRAFFGMLGIRPLSAIAGMGQPVLGLRGRPQLWYGPKHGERVLARLHRPIFARALHEVAYRRGYAEPERYVIWTSRGEPGADHDIRSMDAHGRPRWIEVKSTIGVDGRFDWPRKEFEKALRERERYELWRVYRAADRTPVAKCFRNPARMLGTRQIALELGMLRANIEDLG